MKVAVLGIKTLPAYAGADRVAERVLENLPGEHDVTIYLLRGAQTKLTCTANRHYVYVPAARGKHLRAFTFFLLCTLHFLVKGDADVVHVHNSDFGFFCPLLKLRRGVRVVGTFHGNPYERQKWGWFARAFLRASEWCFVRTCDELTSVAATKVVAGRTVHHIPNGADAAEQAAGIDAALPYDRLGLAQGTYLMFACGRLDATKGLHHVLDAYAARDDLPKLLVVGDFSHDLAYTREIERRAATDARIVLWPQLLGREALFEAIRNARLFVFPSDIEAMSMVLLEAVACGKTVVCSDIPENVAVVGADYPYLFAAGSAESLATVLGTALADDAELTERLAQITRRFRWSEIATRYEALYHASGSRAAVGREVAA